MSSENLQCSLCGKDHLKIYDRYAKCLNCDLHVKLIKDIVSPEAEKNRYETHNNSEDDEGYLGYLSKLLDFIPDFKGPVLDFGCGATKGLEALFLKKDIKMDITSYDPYFYPIGLRGKKFKTIYASECFEHFNNPKKTIQKILSLMSSDSTLAVRTELYNEELGPIHQWWYFRDPTHVCFFTPKTFSWISNEFNLNIVYLKSPYAVLKPNS